MHFVLTNQRSAKAVHAAEHQADANIFVTKLALWHNIGLGVVLLCNEILQERMDLEIPHTKESRTSGLVIGSQLLWGDVLCF